MRVRNPILPGFYPDPSVCRVGEDFYLVNSSFEYFPGVPIHHSRDLVNWRPIGHCLTRASQLPLKGAPPSDGIYAPTIRHHEGRLYMVTTNIRGGGNFFVHTDDPAGEWSEPVWLAQGGIDPSLLFDDGRVYLTSNGTNWAPVRGIYQCEVDPRTGRQLTETRFLWAGTGGAYPEAPHLFKKDEFYYLSVAEGGTAEGHMVTMARSRGPYGPFEPSPQNPILTHRSLMSPVQATGHADLFEDHRGQWWAVFLGFRYGLHGWHQLGRETYLAPVEWSADGWPVINGGQPLALEADVDRTLPEEPFPEPSTRDDFDHPVLGPLWVHLRNPEPENFSLKARPGWLTLACDVATLNDTASPAFAGRRQQHFECTATTCLDFQPSRANEEAGLTVLANNAHHAEIAATVRNGKKCLIVRQRIGPVTAELACEPAADGLVEMRISADRARYLFEGRHPEAGWKTLASTEARYLSTEVAGGYTGAVLGLYATGNGIRSDRCAHFDWFDYIPAEK